LLLFDFVRERPEADFDFMRRADFFISPPVLMAFLYRYGRTPAIY
jgi:hypothetical protein